VRNAAAGFVTCAVLLALLTSCVNSSGWIKECNHSLPERGKWANPVYLAARNVKHEQDPRGAILTTFETSDSPEQVLAYYDSKLIDAGWERDQPGSSVQHDLYFTIANCCYFGSATVDATPAGQGVTTVMVTNSWSMGCG
jgi:hypothetical protein